MGYRLRMSGEIHDWLADLNETDPPAAMQVGQALAALMSEGAGLGPPLVVPVAATWPEDMVAALDASYEPRGPAGATARCAAVVGRRPAVRVELGQEPPYAQLLVSVDDAEGTVAAIRGATGL